jgi:hypothetical protein
VAVVLVVDVAVVQVVDVVLVDDGDVAAARSMGVGVALGDVVARVGGRGHEECSRVCE